MRIESCRVSGFSDDLKELKRRNNVFVVSRLFGVCILESRFGLLLRMMLL